MTIAKITIGPVPHSKGTWYPNIAEDPGYMKEAYVFHNGSTYQSTIDNNHTEPSYTYNSATGEYTVSAGWELVAVGTNAVDLLNGTLVPKYSTNLDSWAGKPQSVSDVQTQPVITTGGDVSIDSSINAILMSIVAKTDFAATALLSTGFNLLRNAVAVGDGWYFPVPAMAFGALNSAAQPNGILFTDSYNNNLTPTVRFKALSAGVPTSVSDGSACTYTDAGGYRFYTTPQAGYIIVSGIVRTSVCAHIGWSGRYDEYISVAVASDAGASIALAAAIHSMHSYDEMLVVAGRGDRIDRISATQVRLTTYNDKVKPTWTNTPDDAENPTSYTHTATISGMLSNGVAVFQNDNIELSVDGTTISYTDANAAASTDWVKYQKSAAATSNYNLATAFAVEDWGCIILQGATGEAFVEISYAQGIPDNVRALVSGVLDGKLEVIAQALAELFAENAALKRRLTTIGSDLNLHARTIDTEDEMVHGVPKYLRSTVTGAPSAANIPDNWNEDLYGKWTGVPRDGRQEYVDGSGKWYKPKANLSNSTEDWVAMN